MLEVAASQSDDVMTHGTRIQALNHHFIIHSLEERESGVAALQTGKLKLQEV